MLFLTKSPFYPPFSKGEITDLPHFQLVNRNGEVPPFGKGGPGGIYCRRLQISGFIFNLVLRGIGPEPLELVELPGFRLEDVHYEIHIIDQHPARILDSFHVPGLYIVFLLDLFLQVAAHRPNVDVGIAFGNDEIIGNL